MLLRGNRPVKRVLRTGRGQSVAQEAEENERMNKRLVTREEEGGDLVFGCPVTQLIAVATGATLEREASPEMRD